MKSTVDYYNKTAQSWADSGYGHAGDADAAPMLAFAQTFPSGSRFLDLCCGCGYDTARLASLGYDAVGIDFSEESIRIARERNPSLTFYVDNMLNDYTYIGKVDAIFVIAGLIHLETPQLRLAFQRMRDVLTEDGALFLTVRDGTGKLENRSLQTIDGETYDRNFIAHTLPELTESAAPLFAFSHESGEPNGVWRSYVFRCV